jgi:small-conductance mechanosensitive channel
VLVAFGRGPASSEEALIDAARACDGVLQEPPPAVRFRESGASTLRFELLAWTARMVHRPGALISQLNVLIHDSLRRRGVALPSSQIDVRIRDSAEHGVGPSDPRRGASV